MNRNRYVLAHDLGTGGDKCILLDTQTGAIVAEAFESYPTFYPSAGQAEQRPNDWWQAVEICTQRVLVEGGVKKEEIACISFSGHMLGCVPISKDGKLLREKVPIWSDSRAIRQANGLLEKAGGYEQWYRLTGGGLRPENYSAPKILWLKENEPHTYRNAYKFLGTKDYVIWRLTGKFVTDYSEASGTGVFNLTKREWAYRLIKACGLEEEKLPELLSSTDVAGMVRPEAAREIGLSPSTPVVIGGGDVSATAVGAGVVIHGRVYNYVGSSAWVGACTNEPLWGSQVKPYIFCHLIPEKYTSQVAIYCAGSAFEWAKENLCPQEEEQASREGVSVYALMDRLAARVEPGAAGLLFIPSLLGGGTLHRNPNMRGAFIGLTLHHTRAHLLRAILEGVGFDLKQILDIFETVVGKISEIRLVGGVTKSSLWCSILANIYSKPVVPLSISQSTAALGAAIAGGVGVGIWPNFAIVDELIRTESCFEPDASQVQAYKSLYSTFTDTERILLPIFDKLASLDIYKSGHLKEVERR